MTADTVATKTSNQKIAFSVDENLDMYPNMFDPRLKRNSFVSSDTILYDRLRPGGLYKIK
jgi:hypothetical protein